MSGFVKSMMLPTSFAGVLLGGSICFREWVIATPSYESDKDLEDVTVVVTGANSGIGRAVTERLAKKRARVIMACRDMTECQKVRKNIVLSVANRQVVCRELNLASYESVRNFAKRMILEEPRINILINNAAEVKKFRKLTPEGIERSLGVNYLGHYLLTLLLLDKVSQTNDSRIINITDRVLNDSEINYDDLNLEKSYKPRIAYTQSKLALIQFTHELAEILKDSPTKVIGVYPGVARTKLHGFGKIKKTINFFFNQSAEQAANNVVFGALDDRVESGEVYACYEPDLPPVSALDPQARQRLWLTSQKWTRLAEQQELLRKDLPEPAQKTVEETKRRKRFYFF